jgi:dolichyl-phosphate-mannose-protein mannosyltransferase
MLKILEKYYLIFLGCILVFSLCARLYRLSEPKTYVFDEVYHAITSKLINRNDPRAYEWWNEPVEPNTAVDWLHPPYAKYTQALGMKIFGENSFGWRISSVIFGVLVIAATAALADQLFDNKPLALLAALFASLDGLLLVQSRIAMNDIHVTFFILLTLIAYLKYRQNSSPKRTNFSWLFMTGLFGGMAMGTKWSGVFIVAAVGGFEGLYNLSLALTQRVRVKNDSVSIFQRFMALFTEWPRKVLFLLVVPAIMYLFAYTHMFLQGKTLICEGNSVEQGKCYCSQESSFWVTALEKIDPSNATKYEAMEARGGCKRLISHFSELHHQIIWYQTNLKATHDYQSRPLQWFLDLRPVWMYVKYDGDHIENIYNLGNPIVFWLGGVSVIITLFYVGYKFGQDLQEHSISAIEKLLQFTSVPGKLLFLLIAYFIVWLPWELSPRIMFFYHYTPAVPLMCILLAYSLLKMHEEDSFSSKVAFYVAIFSAIACFVIFYPNWTGISVPITFAKTFYYFLPSWK